MLTKIVRQLRKFQIKLRKISNLTQKKCFESKNWVKKFGKRIYGNFGNCSIPNFPKIMKK